MCRGAKVYYSCRGFRGAEMQRCGGAEVQMRSRGAELQRYRYRGTEVQRYRVTELQSYRGTEVLRYRGTGEVMQRVRWRVTDGAEVQTRCRVAEQMFLSIVGAE
jgi:hypothetical protein